MMDSGLERLLGEIQACRICRDRPSGKPLPHEPRPVLQASATARLLIAGQAPGTRVHESGRPFTDASGDRLRDWLGLTPETFYDASRIAIVPMGFCFPGQDAKGGDLPPRRECAKAWRQPLLAALPQIELVVLVGTHAQTWHLGSEAKAGMTESDANWRQHLARRPKLIALPHPSWRNTAWLKRHGWFETELLPALRAEVSKLLD
jgi:uracil-DNA glycosylase